MKSCVSQFGDIITKEINDQISIKLDILKESLLTELKEKLLGSFYLTREELRKYLKFKSISSVDNMVKFGLKKYKVGSKTLFKRFEVDEFVDNLN